MSSTLYEQSGRRYIGSFDEPKEKSGPAAAARKDVEAAAVLEFVSYLYNFIRDDAAMIARLDHALKERYGQR